MAGQRKTLTKTTIVNAILRILSAKGVEILLCAPTGRAAKRMSEATGFEVKTIDRVLEVDRDGNTVWSLDSGEIPGIPLFWVTQLQALPNGNVVVTNTHAEADAPQIIEVTRDKEVVWSFLDWETFGNNLCANILLDVDGLVIR